MTNPNWRNGIVVEITRIPNPATVVNAEPARAPPVLASVVSIASSTDSEDSRSSRNRCVM